jgi:hypothetical protein
VVYVYWGMTYFQICSSISSLATTMRFDFGITNVWSTTKNNSILPSIYNLLYSLTHWSAECDSIFIQKSD